MEAHLLNDLRRAVGDRKRANSEHNSNIPLISQLILLSPDKEPGLSLGLRIQDSPLFLARILIYGVRPVRYQVQLSSKKLGIQTINLWNHCLGSHNMVSSKSGQRNGSMQLFYEVTYSDAFLKQIGE